MRKFILGIITIAHFGWLWGQGDLRQGGNSTTNKWSMGAGGCWDLVPIYFDDNTTLFFGNTIPDYYGISFRASYVLLHSGDWVSISGASGANINVNFSSSGTGVFLRVPLYALFRVGCNATPYNDQVIGLGIGAGGAFNYLRLPYFNGLSTDVISQPYVAPTLIAEINWKARFGQNGIQFYYNPINAKGKSSNTLLNPIPIRIGGIGFGLYYSF